MLKGKYYLLFGVLAWLVLFNGCKKEPNNTTRTQGIPTDTASFFIGTYMTDQPMDTLDFNCKQVIITRTGRDSLQLQVTTFNHLDFTINPCTVYSYSGAVGELTVQDTAALGACTLAFSSVLGVLWDEATPPVVSFQISAQGINSGCSTSIVYQFSGHKI